MKNDLVLNMDLENRIRELAQLNGGPFYLYDTAKILQNCHKLLDISYVPKSIHFALMANSTPQFIKIIKEAGLNVFVNSILHLETVRKIGYRGEEIVYAASAMDEATMKKVKSCNALVILDSVGQFDRWRSLFPDDGVGIRCNIGELVVPKKTIAGYFIGKKSRLGFSVNEIYKLKGDPAISGLHIYVGTNILDINYFLDCYDHIARLAELFPQLQYLDFGGGFGLGEDPSQQLDMQIYGQKVSNLMDRLSAKTGRQIKLILEPGRIIGGDAGYFICEVVDVKVRGDHQLIGVNASCVQFPRPLFYPESAFHPVLIIHKNDYSHSDSRCSSSIFGCSTYSRDFLSQNISLPKTSVGDLVVMGYAGSYCSSAHTKFLGFPEAEEYFV